MEVTLDSWKGTPYLASMYTYSQVLTVLLIQGASDTCSLGGSLILAPTSSAPRKVREHLMPARKLSVRKGQTLSKILTTGMNH